jgi:hypothetical protein
MTKKNTYTIDGEELQKRISSEIDFVKHSYSSLQLFEQINIA